VCSKDGRRTLARSVERSRKTIRCMKILLVVGAALSVCELSL
jgi:hypothetical protein